MLVPAELKNQIGKRAPQFAGYSQQDAQEFMSFLMDGLHEDINRVKEKPYTTDVESNGRPDEVVAKEAWDTYLKRNQSFIVDTFAGQLRSHVKCNVCGKDSTTFDPFMSLSVPLPYTKYRPFLVCVPPSLARFGRPLRSVFIDAPQFNLYPHDGSMPIRYIAWVPENGSLLDVKEWLRVRGAGPWMPSPHPLHAFITCTERSGYPSGGFADHTRC